MSNDSFSINLTVNAIKRIQSLLPTNEANNFRVYVTGGGCSGFQYGFKFDENQSKCQDYLRLWRVFYDLNLVVTPNNPLLLPTFKGISLTL